MTNTKKPSSSKKKNIPASSKSKPAKELPPIAKARLARGIARPFVARMQEIHRQLETNHYPNCKKLAELLEVSQKTIQRDLEYMRDRTNLPIEFSHLKKGYYYTKPVTHLPTFEISEGEIVALLVAQKALEQYQGTPFEQPLLSAFRKITDGLRGNLSFDWDTMQSAISFKEIGGPAIDLGIFEALSRAIQSSREVTFRHAKLRGSTVEKRHVRPYHMACVEKQWYLFGYDIDRKDIRTYSIIRIQQVEITGKTFVRPEDFTIADYLDGAFGVFRGQNKHQIRIRFDQFASRLVSERQWHASQEIEPLNGEDGMWSELTMELGSLEEIERWVLSWGAHARVMEPPELVTQIKEAASGLLKRYS